MTAALTTAEVAGALGLSREWFERHRGALQAEHGFPAPLPGIRPRRWSADRVQGWINDPPAGDAGNDNNAGAVDGWAAELDRRAAELAGLENKGEKHNVKAK
jgi:hypothetical protein